jgi:hypothetical protein
MSDPTRLLSAESGEANEFERELLGSWGTEQPSEAARAKVLGMVGLGAGAIAATAVAGKAGATVGGSIAPKVGAVGATALAKWLAVGALGFVTVGATVAYVRHARREVPPAPVVTAPVATSAPAPEAAPARAGADVASPVAPEAPARGTPSPHRDRATRAADPALGEQVAALDRARRALGDGDAVGALRDLDDYQSRFPRGALAEEAEVLRVEALLAEGDRASAARAGARFLAAHPESPHAARVRSLLRQ